MWLDNPLSPTAKKHVHAQTHKGDLYVVLLGIFFLKNTGVLLVDLHKGVGAGADFTVGSGKSVSFFNKKF